jgi:hypothetical protein
MDFLKNNDALFTGKEENQEPYKPNPDKPTNSDISVENQKEVPNPNSDSSDNSNPPPPEDIHELPPEEPIKPDNPVDIFPDLPSDPPESDEAARQEIFKIWSEEEKEFHNKIFEPALKSTRYVETSIPHPPRNAKEFIDKNTERLKTTYQEIFTSPVISSTSDFFGKYIIPLIDKKKLYSLSSCFRRKTDNSLD